MTAQPNKYTVPSHVYRAGQIPKAGMESVRVAMEDAKRFELNSWYYVGFNNPQTNAWAVIALKTHIEKAQICIVAALQQLLGVK